MRPLEVLEGEHLGVVRRQLLLGIPAAGAPALEAPVACKAL